MASQLHARQARAHDPGTHGLTVEHAIDHVVESATGVVKTQLELARLDLQVTLRRVVRSATLIVVGAFLMAGACVALVLMAYASFPDHVPPEQRLAMLAAAAGGGGIALATIGIRQVQPNGASRLSGGH